MEDEERTTPKGFDPAGVSNVVEDSELKQALRELNDDTIDEDSNFSNIDMRTRVSSSEIPAISLPMAGSKSNPRARSGLLSRCPRPSWPAGAFSSLSCIDRWRSSWKTRTTAAAGIYRAGR